MKSRSRSEHLKNHLLAQSITSCSHTSTIVTRLNIHVGYSYNDDTIRRFNLQLIESCLTLWELELPDSALEDKCVIRGEERRNEKKYMWNELKLWGVFIG
jgi:hypothetical protein